MELERGTAHMTAKRRAGLTGFDLKIIALALMVLDHIHYFFEFTGAVPLLFTQLGRLSAGLFLFSVVEGFVHTHDRKKYFLRIYLISLAMGLTVLIGKLAGWSLLAKAADISYVLLLIIGYLIFGKKITDETLLSGLSMILAGGLSNLIDRILRGYVVDCLDFTQLINFPVFNFADVCVVMGAAMLIYYVLIEEPKKKKKAAAAVEEQGN